VWPALPSNSANSRAADLDERYTEPARTPSATTFISPQTFMV
jgi:hypothetical protein